MPVSEKFDFPKFVEDLREYSPEDRREKVNREHQRVKEMTIRESGQKFQQQLYVGRLERLGRHLKGIDVSRELTPSEVQAYSLLSGTPAAPAAVEEAPVAAPAPPPPPAPAPAKAAAPAAAPAAQGKERRTSRRIAMRTKIYVRRDGDKTGEVTEPVNVSKGGVSFVSRRKYGLHENVFVTMHYTPGGEGMGTKSLVVRAAKIAESPDFSYGIKFLE